MISFRSVADAWLADCALLRAKSTLENYRTVMRLLFARLPELETRPITRADLLLFRTARAAEVHPRTVNQNLRAVRACLNWAELNEAGHPSVKLRKLLLPEGPREDWTLTPEQMRRVLEEAQFDPPVHVVLRICEATGLRIREVTSLRWADVDAAEGCVRVRAKEDWQGKTENAYRTVYAAELVEWLGRYRLTLRFRGAEDPVCQRSPARGLAWRTRSNAIHRRVRRVFDRAGVLEKHKTTHRFRHTLATDLAESGAPVHVAQKLLGHSNPTITLGVYTRARQKGLAAACSALEQYRAARGSAREG